MNLPFKYYATMYAISQKESLLEKERREQEEKNKPYVDKNGKPTLSAKYNVPTGVDMKQSFEEFQKMNSLDMEDIIDELS